MASSHGKWIWYELMAADPDAATRFYESVIGWNIANPGHDGFDYREITARDSAHVGGMMALTPEMTAGGARTGWIGYLCCDDVDATIAALTAAGGKVYMPARDMPGVGRFVMVADCCGAVFYVMTPTPPPGGGESTSFSDQPNPGHCGWNELYAGNQDNALAFYTGLFGWSLPDAMDMGPMGKYQFIALDEVTIGAVMTKPEAVPVAVWCFYFWVEGITSAIERIKAGGGQVVNGPHQVPGGLWTVQALDPQGALFSLVGGE